MEPLITVGIASYNYAGYLARALEQIRKQKFTQFEILISDDCSTDDSLNVIKTFMSDNPQISCRLIENEKNGGLIANKNKIVQNCRGKYLMLCDADDWMDENCLERIANVILREDPDRVLVEVAHTKEDGSVIQVEHIPANQTKWGWNIHHGCAYKSSIIRTHNIKMREGLGDDLYFTIEFSKHCQKVSIINETLYYWHVHLDSEGRKVRNQPIKEIVDRSIRSLRYIDNTIKYINKRNDGQAAQDKEELRLVMLKIYYFRILFSCQRDSLKNKWIHYRNLHKTMLEIDKNYLRNSYINKRQENEDVLRPYAMRAIRLCSKLERIHFMPLALTGYHILGEFMYFDQ